MRQLTTELARQQPLFENAASMLRKAVRASTLGSFRPPSVQENDYFDFLSSLKVCVVWYVWGVLCGCGMCVVVCVLWVCFFFLCVCVCAACHPPPPFPLFI